MGRRTKQPEELVETLPALWPYLDDESRATLSATRAAYAGDVCRMVEAQLATGTGEDAALTA